MSITAYVVATMDCIKAVTFLRKLELASMSRSLIVCLILRNSAAPLVT